MAKSKKQKQKKQAARSLNPQPVLPSESVRLDSKSWENSSIAALVAAGVILIIASWIVFNSLNSVKKLNLPESSEINLKAIPLESNGNSGNLQSGQIPIQNQSNAPQDTQGNLNSLQPQQSVTPEQLKQLQ